MGGATEYQIVNTGTHMCFLGEFHEEDEVFEDGGGDPDHVVVGRPHLEVAESVKEEACMGDGVGYSFEAADEGEEVVVRRLLDADHFLQLFSVG